MALEARELRGAAPVPANQAALALKSATDRLGDKGRIAVQNDRATLTLSGVTGEALRAWLTEARSGARARPIEAQLTRGPQGYAGTIVLTFGGGQ
jgi:general secretion pathway protein M